MLPTSEKKIAERSYQIWESEGRPEGKHLQHWFQAVAELETKPARKTARSKSARPAAAAGQKSTGPRKHKSAIGNA